MSTASRRVVIPVVVALTAGAMALALLVSPALTGGSSSRDASDEAAQRQRADASRDASRELRGLERRKPGEPVAMGRVDAPVVMIAYSDFQCPFCGKFARDSKPALVDRFVRAGVLRIEWRDFPYLGEESVRAAHAARAAAAQGAFWKFHDALYADQPRPNTGRWTQDYFVGVARELGLDVSQFQADLRSRAVARTVQEDFEEGQRIGVTGTPAFLVNGQPIMGAQPTQVFVDTIERAAADAR